MSHAPRGVLLIVGIATVQDVQDSGRTLSPFCSLAESALQPAKGRLEQVFCSDVPEDPVFACSPGRHANYAAVVELRLGNFASALHYAELARNCFGRGETRHFGTGAQVQTGHRDFAALAAVQRSRGRTSGHRRGHRVRSTYRQYTSRRTTGWLCSPYHARVQQLVQRPSCPTHRGCPGHPAGMRVPQTVIRRNRALTTFALAGLVILVAGAIYLRPSLTAPADQRVPASSGVIVGSLRGVSFGDADHGAVEVVGLQGGFPETYVTANAGRSWTRMPAPFDAVMSVQFFDSRRVIARTAGPSSGDTLRLSGDGGHTWRLLATPPVQSGSLYFLDSQNGWRLATEPFALTPHAPDTYLWKLAIHLGAVASTCCGGA